RADAAKLLAMAEVLDDRRVSEARCAKEGLK
ncbi:hypothetical protein PSYMO_38123, partial [Pseudomonas amygdali pv. mori str. 301020]